MWSNLVYMLPAASIMSKYAVDDEVAMHGDLMEELEKLFVRYLKNTNLELKKTNLRMTINAVYPKGTTIWTILDGIIVRFHLMVYLKEEKDGRIILSLEESAAWKR